MRDPIFIYNKELKPICRDYGERFAKSLELAYSDYRNWLTLELTDDRNYIIDMMCMTDRFADWIRTKCFNKDNVFYRFVDSYFTTNTPALNSILTDFRYSSRLGTKIISPYEYKYAERYIPMAIPYHYEIKDERPISSNRLSKAILSGCKDADYPMRYDLYERSNESPYIDIHKHPGYEVGESLDDYLDNLSQYKLMIVTTSQDFELLKYVECAEAGCCPIGEFPSSLLKEMPSSLKWLQCFTATKVIQRIPEILPYWRELAEEYRYLMKRLRYKNMIMDKYLNLH